MTDNIKPTVQEKSAWAKVPQEFNDWWNGDYSDESNPFRINSAAYWAWAGWSEAVRLNAQAVPDGWKLVPVQATPDMCKASVIYANGNAVYKNVAHEALEIEESIYSEVYAAMLSAAPPAPQPAQQNYLEMIYEYLVSTAPAGYADEAFRIVPEEVFATDSRNRISEQRASVGQYTGALPVASGSEEVGAGQAGCDVTTAPQPAQQPLADEKDAMLRRALEALEGFVRITNDSQGVAGYHLSGDTAEWDEFDEIDAASNTIEAIRNHLGVKND